jgi:hypothetical protein
MSSTDSELLMVMLIVAASLMAANCSPMYSIGVRGTLTHPLDVNCILNAAQTTEGVQHVLIHQNKPREGKGVVKTVDDIMDPPTTYLVTTSNQQDAQIEQRPLQDGRAVIWVGRQRVGITPSLRTIEADQAFYVSVVSHIMDVCKTRLPHGLSCVPASDACRKLLSTSPSSE